MSAYALRLAVVLWLLPLAARAQDTLKDYVNAKDQHGLTTLHYAAAKGAADTARILIEKGARVDVRDNQGSTPLHYAAYKGHLNVVEVLLSKGADINAKDKAGATPLSYAEAGNQEEVAHLLRVRNAKEGKGDLSKKQLLPNVLKEVQIQFESVPSGAMVEVAGKLLCNTPCSMKFPYGEYRVGMQAKWRLYHQETRLFDEDATIKYQLKEMPAGPDVLVVKSKKFALYDKAIAGFREVFKGSVEVITLEGPYDEVQKYLDHIRKVNPKVILTVGLRASKLTLAYIKNVPVAFMMAMHPVANGLSTEVSTGVELEPSIQKQLSAFKRMVPNLKKIGLIYDPKRTGAFVEAARKAAENLGLKIIAHPVGSQEEAHEFLLKIVGEVQALWLIRDATVLTRTFFNQSLVLQLSKRLPVIAYSSQFVKKGAFCSYSSTYPRQGKKAAELVKALMAGKDPAEMEVVHPEGILTINLKIAEKMKFLPPNMRKILPGGKDVIEYEFDQK